MRPTLARVASAPVKTPDAMLGAEDFSYFAQRVPGLFVFLGARPKGEAPEQFAANHSPRFHLDEGVLPVGAAFFERLVREAAAVYGT